MNKDKRVPIMMSEEELAALDEWRFANKIASRGEAIRWLIYKGIIPDEVAGRVKKGGSK